MSDFSLVNVQMILQNELTVSFNSILLPLILCGHKRFVYNKEHTQILLETAHNKLCYRQDEH